MTEPASRTGGDFDTIVIGGGVVGLSLSWFLAADGAALLCLDHGTAAGSTANAGSLHVQMQSRLERLFPERVPDVERALPLYPLAVDSWTEVARDLGEDIGLKVAGGLMVAETEVQLEQLADKSRRERDQGVETEIIGAGELRRLAPYLDERLVGASYCPKEGKVDPLLANAALRRRAEASGAVIRDGVFVDAVEIDRGGVRVLAGESSYRAARVVIAAGAGSSALAASLGLKLPVAAEPLHMNITEAAEPFMPHLVQHAERPITMKQLGGGHVVVGGGWPAELAPAPAAPPVTLESLLGNLGLARDLVPGIASLRILRTWAGINPTADLLSVVGDVEGLPGAWFAIPGDAGYTLGPCLARLLAERMAGRDPGFPLQAFSPARFGRT